MEIKGSSPFVSSGKLILICKNFVFMKRSKWKLKNLINFTDDNLGKPIYITKRDALISDVLVNKKVFVYNGKMFFSLFVDKEKVGFKFGEFAYSRRKGVHKKKKK